MKELLGYINNKVVPTATLKKRNEQKAWEYGYCKEFDLVIISKDGTLGDVYELEGLKIGLPAIPKDKTKIINHDKPK